jgi:recombination protein RecT
MNTAVATIIEPPEKPMVVLGNQLEEMADKWRQALPAHIPLERFKRVVMTAIQHNPQLVMADRYTLWTSATKAAQDGLLPDGREGALVIFRTKVKVKDKTGKEVEQWIDAVTWMPMIAGIRKKVRNSGEIKDWNARVVYQKDKFVYRLGDDEFIEHEPYTGSDEPGEIVAAYSIARLKSGEVSREVMTRRQIDKVRLVSKSKDGPAWTQWFDEMARKTVARRHSKVLPMSTDLDDLIRQDDHLYEVGAQETAPQRPKLADFKPVPGTPLVEVEDKPEDVKPEEQSVAEEERTEFGHADARELGVAHRNANKPMSAPPDLAQEFHDAFLDGWRARDDDISVEAKKAGAKK